MSAINAQGAKHVIAGTANGLGTAGVEVSKSGSVAYTVTSGEDSTSPVGLVNVVRPNGTVGTLGDLARLEARRNPDAHHVYGFIGLSKACAAQVPAEIGGTSHGGDVNSNPYAIKSMPDGSWIVADAGGNDLIRISHGRLSVLTVLPTSKVKITSGIATGLGLPACTIGKTYAFDPVPTDVERGPNGMLYVTSLPGGPEDASLGARGAVYGVNPCTGKTWLVARGLLGATDLAVAPNGGHLCDRALREPGVQDPARRDHAGPDGGPAGGDRVVQGQAVRHDRCVRERSVGLVHPVVHQPQIRLLSCPSRADRGGHDGGCPDYRDPAASSH